MQACLYHQLATGNPTLVDALQFSAGLQKSVVNLVDLVVSEIFSSGAEDDIRLDLHSIPRRETLQQVDRVKLKTNVTIVVTMPLRSVPNRGIERAEVIESHCSKVARHIPTVTF